MTANQTDALSPLSPPVSVTPPASVSVETFPGTGLPPRAVYPFGWSRGDMQRLLALLIAGGFALYFLWLVQSVLPPFLIAFVLSALSDPIICRLENRGYSRVRAITTLYLLGLLFVIFLAVAIFPVAKAQLDDVANNFKDYYEKVQHIADNFLQHNAKILRLFGVQQQKLNDLLNGPLKSTLTGLFTGLTLFMQGIASKSLWFIVIPIASFFLIRDYPVIRARMIALFPESYHEKLDTIGRKVVEVFGDYVRGLGKICALFGFVAFLVLMALGVRYALFLGLLAGVFYAVPYIGQLVTASVVGAVCYSMETHHALFFFSIPANSLPYAITVVVTLIVIQNIFDQILYPRIVGGSVGLHPVVSLFALAAGATLLGLWGMLLAVPVAASIQIVLMYSFPKLKQPPPDYLLNRRPVQEE